MIIFSHDISKVIQICLFALLVTEAKRHGHYPLYWPENDKSIEIYILNRPVRCNMKQIVDSTMTKETEAVAQGRRVHKHVRPVL
jgi:hypothetical protein